MRVNDYRLDRCTILLVEDNAFIRQTLEDLLRHFGIGQVLTANNGEEAISLLKGMKNLGSPGPDLIISDIVMTPIDGLLLLRWVRASPESPNRFVPFMMMSGAADREYVSAARDLGANEFLAKPFSVYTVFSHIAEVIEKPRPFIVTKEFFGPDRRRGEGVFNTGKDLRRPTANRVIMVYSAHKTVKPKTENDVWCFSLPNSLRDKVGGSWGVGTPVLPEAILEEAEACLQRQALDFTPWAKDYLAALGDLCNDAMAAPNRRIFQFAEINRLAHELRGLGSTFGYPLISTFGKMLYDGTREKCAVTDNRVEIVRAHVDAMRAVIRERIAGDGGEVGVELRTTLETAIERYQTVA